MGRRADQIDSKSAEIIIGIEDQEDPRMAWGQVKRHIDALREAGREVPEALIVAERNLMTEFMAQSQGR